jgi:PAS domain S-box-containing protein
MTVDWSAIAHLFSERLEKPTFVLDRQGLLRLFSAGMERLMGWRRHDLLGKPWTTCFSPAGDAEQGRWCLDEAMRGAFRQADCTATTGDGRKLILDLTLEPVGQGRAAGLVCTVEESRDAVDDAPPRFAGDVHYEIDSSSERFGVVLRQWGAGELSLVGRLCYEALHARPRPCEGCPATQVLTFGRITKVVRPTDESSPFRIVTAERLGDQRVRLSVRTIDEVILGGLVQAKIAQLAERSSLSEREREVLNLLVLGRSAHDIAHVLAISPRTVKFHQANVLAKLGADSKVDLLRLIF